MVNEDLIGCGAIKVLSQNHGEFKSIRVHDKFREKGFGKKIISILLSKSRDIGLKNIFIDFIFSILCVKNGKYFFDNSFQIKEVIFLIFCHPIFIKYTPNY